MILIQRPRDEPNTQPEDNAPHYTKAKFSAWEAEAGEYLSSRSGRETQWDPDPKKNQGWKILFAIVNLK